MANYMVMFRYHSAAQSHIKMANISSPVPVAARHKAWVYDRSLAGIVGSNPTMHCLLPVLCVVR